MSKKFIIGIDLGGTNLKIALLDLKYKIIYSLSLSTREFRDRNSLIAAIVSSVNKIIKKGNLTKARILGVGLGLPGLINSERGLVHSFTNIPGWKNINLKRILERRLKIPVFLDNDANLMCLAEYKLGAARGATNAVCITLGTGVGGGIIINKKLYRGKTFAAGEIGHIPINEDGPDCNCGGRGCIETYVGNTRIKEMAHKVFGRAISLEELSELARKKNGKAIAIWSKVGNRLGLALTGVVNTFNPDCIVIGGGVAAAGKVLFEKIRTTVARQAMPVQAAHVKILRAKLGSDAGLVGAALLASEGAKNRP